MSDDDNWQNPASLDEFLEQYRVALNEFASLDAEADRIERQEKIVLAELVNHGEGSVAARENAAKANPRYAAICDQIKEARTKANLAKAKCEHMRTRWESWRTRAANRRAEMGFK